jgi:hypothetical protein
MNAAELLSNAKMQRDAALQRLIEATKAGDGPRMQRTQQTIDDFNAIINGLEKALRNAL